MNRYLRKIQDILENDVSTSDIVNLYNQFADKNSYEHIFNMADFDEIVGTNDRSYSEVKDEVDEDFNNSADYFYMSEAYGRWTSLDDVDELIDYHQLADFASGLDGYPRVDIPDELDNLFCGLSFDYALEDYFNNISKEDLNILLNIDCLNPDHLKFDESDNINTGNSFIMPQLLDLDGYEDNTMQMVFQFPRKLQEIFWDYHEPYFDYAIVNKGIKGAIPIGDALELAGFDKVDNNLYRFNPQYSVKVDNNVIKTIIDSSKSKANGR